MKTFNWKKTSKDIWTSRVFSYKGLAPCVFPCRNGLNKVWVIPEGNFKYQLQISNRFQEGFAVIKDNGDYLDLDGMAIDHSIIPHKAFPPKPYEHNITGRNLIVYVCLWLIPDSNLGNASG